MDKVQLLKDLRKESLQIKLKINKVQDPNKRQQLERSYNDIIHILEI